MEQVTGKQRRISERSLANLRPFPKGVSGNPHGRPRGRTLLAAIREHLEKSGEKDLDGAAKAFVKAMTRGSFNHAKEYIEREEGKLPDSGTLRVEIVHVRPHADANGTDQN